VPDHTERFPSARAIEKVARNPECQTLTTALAANIDAPKKVTLDRALRFALGVQF
jgi:hypothetical protein